MFHKGSFAQSSRPTLFVLILADASVGGYAVQQRLAGVLWIGASFVDALTWMVDIIKPSTSTRTKTMPEVSEKPDQEPSSEVTIANRPVAAVKAKVGRKAFSGAHRELNDTELSSPAVQKLLLDEIDRLERENNELMEYRSRFHDADKRAAVLEQKNTIRTSQEVLSLACITVGGAALGYAPSLWVFHQPSTYMFFAFGLVLVLGGIAAKVVKL